MGHSMLLVREFKFESTYNIYTAIAIMHVFPHAGNFIIRIIGEVRAGSSSSHHTKCQSASGYLCQVINHDGADLG